MAELIKNFADIEKGNGNRLKVTVSEYNGTRYLDLRTWFQDRESKELLPKKQGITLKREVFESLMEALVKSKDEICKLLSETANSRG